MSDSAEVSLAKIARSLDWISFFVLCLVIAMGSCVNGKLLRIARAVERMESKP